jgi:hypothetical protein
VSLVVQLLDNAVERWTQGVLEAALAYREDPNADTAEALQQAALAKPHRVVRAGGGLPVAKVSAELRAHPLRWFTVRDLHLNLGLPEDQIQDALNVLTFNGHSMWVRLDGSTLSFRWVG